MHRLFGKGHFRYFIVGMVWVPVLSVTYDVQNALSSLMSETMVGNQ